MFYKVFDALRGIVADMGFELSGDADHAVVGPGSMFSLHLEKVGAERYFIYVYVRTQSADFAGDRTDLHHLFSILAAAGFRGGASVSPRLLDQPHPVVPDEIAGRYITFDQPIGSMIGPHDAAVFTALLERLALAHYVTHNKLLDGHALPASDSQYTDSRVLRWGGRVADAVRIPLSADVRIYSRNYPAWDHFYDPHTGISVTKSKRLALLLQLVSGRHARGVEGPTAWLLKTDAVMNAVDRSLCDWADNVLDVLEPEELNEAAPRRGMVTPFENWVVAVGAHTVVARPADCGRGAYLEERDRLRTRQQLENRLIFPTRAFTWQPRIAGDRFESLVGALLARMPNVMSVRQVGQSHEPDGGRDFLCDWVVPAESVPAATTAPSGRQPPLKKLRVIVQCKASTSSVGKGQVHGIYDAVQQYGVDGYLLVVSSRLTVPLIDKLEGLRERIAMVDWWDRSTLEDRLTDNRDLLPNFADVVVASEDSAPLSHGHD